MKYFVIILLVFLSIHCHVQSQNSIIKEGIYKSSFFEDDGKGYWVIKSDTTFFYVNINGERINKIGFGTWHNNNDGTTTFTFIKSKIFILQLSKIENYYAETKVSFDSIYISGQIKNQQNIGIDFATIMLYKDYGTFTDKNGYFSIVFPRKYQSNEITIIKKISGYPVVTFSLNPYNNWHRISLIIPKDDSTLCSSIINTSINCWVNLPSKAPNDSIYITKLNKKILKHHFNEILFLTDGKKNLKHTLLKSIEKQPYLKSNIFEILEYIDK